MKNSKDRRLYLTLGTSLSPSALVSSSCFPAGDRRAGWNMTLAQATSASCPGNLLEGLILRWLLLVGYIWAIGFMPDVRRLFMGITARSTRPSTPTKPVRRT
jgi:hypothetical protein